MRRELERSISSVGCPIGEPSRVVKVPAMRPAQNQGVDMPKYLFLQRSVPVKREPPSPAQMQEMYAAFNAWKEKFKENILDMGGQAHACRQGRDHVGSDGRALRRSQGDCGRVHARLR